MNSKLCLGLQKVFQVKQYDTLIEFQDHIAVRGESFDLTGCTVRGVLTDKKGNVLASHAGTVEQEGDDQDPELPNVSWLPLNGSLDVVGVHKFEWEVVNSAGRRARFPRGGYRSIEVVAALDDPENHSSSSSSSSGSSASE
jgi:hypothetical protein